MIQGSCLCGGVRFEIDGAAGPFELCHCRRCRKVSGSAFVAGLYVRRDAFRLLSGHDLVRAYDAPILKAPPAYRASFCGRCGSSLPNLDGDDELMEVPAGLFDDDPGLRPDKHIFVEVKSDWFAITDDLPQLDERALIRQRRSGR